MRINSTVASLPEKFLCPVYLIKSIAPAIALLNACIVKRTFIFLFLSTRDYNLIYYLISSLLFLELYAIVLCN